MNIFQQRNALHSIQIDALQNNSLEIYIKDFSDDNSVFITLSQSQWADIVNAVQNAKENVQ